MPPRDLYIVLGVAPTASADDIRRAYLERARLLHPDSGEAGASHERFVELQAAYEKLSDKDERRRYDAERALTRRVDFEAVLRTDAMRRSGSFVDDMLADEPWATLGRIFTGLGFERLAKNDTGARGRLAVEAFVTSRQALAGAEVTVRVPRLEPCKLCSGWGHFNETRCVACRGLGRARTMQPVVVRVPSFATEETIVERATPELDLVVRVRVKG